MSLWYTPSNQGAGIGKPRHVRRWGTQQAGDLQYRDCSIKLVTFTTGLSVTRNTYQAAISDAGGRSLAYLRGHSSAEQAALAAREWIDRHIARLTRHLLPSNLGRIPTLPPASSESEP
jgi:hypothetical protein